MEQLSWFKKVYPQISPIYADSRLVIPAKIRGGIPGSLILAATQGDYGNR
jgi:hypothetical protein